MANLPANTTARLLSAAATDNATNVSSAPTHLLRISGYNAAAAGRWLKLYDKATAPASTDTPRKSHYLPAATAFVFDLDDYFASGFGYRITGNVADNDATAVTAGDILGLNVDYRL